MKNEIEEKKAIEMEMNKSQMLLLAMILISWEAS